MADIHQVITLGIGTPADIPHLILFGLSPTGPVSAPIVSVGLAYLSTDAATATLATDAPTAALGTDAATAALEHDNLE